ncbi:hypothetical protein HU200_013466 [Digitaria exilis]|uniref:Cytochrome P450 n=1 Tax=Digitaria exilis TaxID=1010633 RepID=A0A835FDV9_9POAL|nr:hypothetical protein HU200_013466 [Digitaria exilis]CAB3489234.1 unnamed protein product [Digitaria exilis]
MEAVQLLTTIILVVTVFLAIIYRQRSSKRSSNLRQPTIKVRDPTITRQTLIDQADAFSNRPPTPFPIPLITGRRHRHGITTVPYGPHWRALRSNLTAAILQPWRQGLMAPLQREAIDALVTSISTRCADDGSGDLVIRDSIYGAVFSMLTTVCFGDDVDFNHVRSMELMMQEFRVAIGEARVLARSTIAKIKHWRQWRRFLGFRTQQVDLFVPLINAICQTRRSTKHGTWPYVDSLIDLRIPDENDPSGANRRALTEDEMVSLIVEFLGAVESIVAVLEWTLAHLVIKPEVQRKVRHELLLVDDVSSKRSGEPGSYLHAVVMENLRLHPPFPLIMREVRSEGAVVGAEIVPATTGMRVQFMLGDIGKDEHVWKDAGEFKPERFIAGGEGEGVGLVPGGSKEIKMVPFGAGQRSCPGAALGVQFIKDLLAAMVREFEWEMPVEGGGGVDMTELYGFITVMKTPLRTHIKPLCA